MRTSRGKLMKRILIYTCAAAVTLTAWLGGFRPGSGDTDRLLAAGTAEAASPAEEPAGDELERSGRVLLFSVEKGRLVVSDKVVKSEEEWKKELSPEQFRVLRDKGTERAGTGHLLRNHEEGTYTCAGCGADLFASDTKFESGTGWPSFSAPVAKENVLTETDDTLGTRRVEILCRRCGGHLGHVFDDGPRPTGLRYCVNSASLDFEKKK
jgi:peptide-methionine (R)-S-oxide reductase